jgi:hypothetical protein
MTLAHDQIDAGYLLTLVHLGPGPFDHEGIVVTEAVTQPSGQTELLTQGHIGLDRAATAFDAYTQATQDWPLYEEYGDGVRLRDWTIRHGWAVVELAAGTWTIRVFDAPNSRDLAQFAVTRLTCTLPGDPQ